jgi:hypothetical protein
MTARPDRLDHAMVQLARDRTVLGPPDFTGPPAFYWATRIFPICIAAGSTPGADCRSVTGSRRILRTVPELRSYS